MVNAPPPVQWRMSPGFGMKTCANSKTCNVGSSWRLCLSGSGGFPCDEYAYSGSDRVFHGVGAIDGKLGQREAGPLYAIAKIAPVAPHMIALPEMREAVALAGDGGILIALFPALHDRHHEQG